MSIFFQFFRNIIRLRQDLRRSDMTRILGLIFLVTMTGTLSYSFIEGWTLLEALYATIITITTVGYGDFTPQTDAGRLFAIFFTLFAIAIGGYSISTLAVYLVESHGKKKEKLWRKRRMNRIQALNKHFIICGADLLALRIASLFAAKQVPFVIIDKDEALLKAALLYTHPEYAGQKLQTVVDFLEADLSHYEDLTLPEISDKLDIPYILDDPTDDTVLIQAGIDRAAGLIATLADDRDNLSIVIGARNLATRANNTALRIMTCTNEPRNVRKMYLAGADNVRIPSVMGGMEMASHMLHPEIGNWWYTYLDQTVEQIGVFKQMNLVDMPNWVGKTVSVIHQTEEKVIVTVKRNGEFISPPSYDFVLAADDVAIVVAKHFRTRASQNR